MKRESGVTLIALVIYILLMTFVVAAMTATTTSFNSNLAEVDKNSESSVAFSKFNMYFLKDIKRKGVIVPDTVSNASSIKLRYTDDSGTNSITVVYSVVNGVLYRDKVKICDKVKDVRFSATASSADTPWKGTIVSVYLKIKNLEKSTQYKVEPKITST